MRDSRLTEQRNPASSRIDELDALGIVDLINAEDHRIAAAVGEEREAIARAVELAERAFRSGGRLIYVGAGTSGRLGVLDAAEMPPTYGTDPAMVRGVIAGGYEALVRAQELAERRGFDLVLVLFPVLWKLSNDYPFAEIHSTVGRFARM